MLDVLLLGDRSRAEFRDVRRMIAETANLVEISDPPAAVAELRSRSTAPLVVVATAYPGQFSTAQIAQLRKESPLVRIVALLGSWCEGEQRTGQPWPADARVYWYEWPAWWSRTIAEGVAGPWGSTGLPLTANNQDRVLTTVATWAPAVRSGLVAVSADDFETFAAISTSIEVAGYRSAWVRSHRPPVLRGVSAGIWVGGQLSLKEQGNLALFCRRFEPSPVAVILDFPRTDAVSTARELGAAHLLGKPFSADELLFVLDRFAEMEERGNRPRMGDGPLSQSA